MEQAMSTINLSVPSYRAYRAARRQQLRAMLVEWWQRILSRYELTSLGEADLRDIGLSRAEAEFESSKPFWQN
jgi:uncharacterized protein YjiS (DUF1127 family)